jgi:hypothetical protein
MQLVERAVEIVFIAEILGNCSVIGASECPRFRRQPSQNVIRVAGGSCLIGERSEMTLGIGGRLNHGVESSLTEHSMGNSFKSWHPHLNLAR